MDKFDALLAACKSIDKRGKGKVVLKADYNGVHEGIPVLIQMGTVTSVPPAAPSTPATPETYPPTIPIALPPIESVGEVTHQWLASCDKHDGTNVATGVASYTPTPTVGGGSEILGTPTDTSIGSYSTAPTYTRVGVDWNMTSGDGGITGGLEDTTDKIAFRGWAYTSHKAVSAVLNTFTASDYPTYPADYDGAGVMLRDSTAAGSKFLALYYAMNGYVFVKWRGTTDGAVSQAYAVTDGSFGLLYILPNGDGTFSCYRQTSGQARQLIHTTTTGAITLSATGIGGTFCFSLTSQVASASFTQIALRSATLITKTTTTAVPVALTLLATDVAGNASAQSASVTATPTADQNHKWNPCYMVRASRQFSSETDATMKSRFDLARTQANLGGGLSWLRWSQLNPSNGVHDFAVIRTMRDYLNNTTIPGRFNVPKVHAFDVNFVKFDVATSSPYSGTMPMPQYIIDGGGTIVEPRAHDASLSIVYPDFDQAWVLDAYIDMWEALGAEFDSDDDIELVCPVAETTQISAANITTIMTAVKAAFPTTNVYVGHNYLKSGEGSVDASFKNAMVALKVGLGGPDILVPGDPYASNGALAWGGVGSSSANGYGTFNFGSINSQGVVPYCMQRQVAFNSNAASGDDSEIIAYAVSQKATHVAFDFDNDSGDYNGNASFSQLMTLIGANPVHTTYPTGY